MILMKFFLLTEKTKKSSTEVGVQIQSKVGVLQKDIEWEFRSSEARSRNLYQETTIACTREDPLIISTRGVGTGLVSGGGQVMYMPCLNPT